MDEQDNTKTRANTITWANNTARANLLTYYNTDEQDNREWVTHQKQEQRVPGVRIAVDLKQLSS